MTKIPLSAQEVALYGFTHAIIIDPTDLSETATGTAQTIALLDVAAGDIVERIAVKLETAFEDASDGAFNTTLLKIGDGVKTDRYLPNVEGNKNGTEITVAHGAGPTLELLHPLTSLATGLSTAAIDLKTNFTLPFDGWVVGFRFVTTVAGTGSGASQVFNLEIGTTDLTGGVLTLTLANQNTIGAVVSSTAITGANKFAAGDTLSIEMAASGTVFTAGAGYFVIEVRPEGSSPHVYAAADTIDLVVGSQTSKALSDIDAGRLQILLAVRQTGRLETELAL